MLPTASAASDDPTEISQRGDEFRQLYQTYFEKAELKRRWNVQRDIPWTTVKHRAVDAALVDILEAFYATEMFLPDYTSKLMHLNRGNQGMAWFMANWGYEESKHSMALEEWFIRSGSRSPEQMRRLNDDLLQNEWMLPFETSRQMLVYTLFQELATQHSYLGVSKLTAPAADPALQRLLLLIAGDEGNHHKLFVSCVAEHLQRDREGTLDDIAFVLANFAMPAHGQIPGWEERGRLIESTGIYSARVFVTRVMSPGLARLGVDSKVMRPYFARHRLKG